MGSQILAAFRILQIETYSRDAVTSPSAWGGIQASALPSSIPTQTSLSSARYAHQGGTDLWWGRRENSSPVSAQGPACFDLQDEEGFLMSAKPSPLHILPLVGTWVLPSGEPWLLPSCILPALQVPKTQREAVGSGLVSLFCLLPASSLTSTSILGP